MKSKGTTLTEIIISIMLISVVMMFVFNILIDLKKEDKVSQTNGVESLQRSSYTRLIQNDLINEKLTGISTCNDGELCFDLNFENTGAKRFKVENNAVIYNDEKWEVDSGEFLKNKVQFIYKMASNDEELLKNTNANNYYLLKIVLPDLDKTESNRKIDPEITNIGVGKLNIDCHDIKNKLKNAEYVECDGFELESEEEVEKNDPHTVRLHLGSDKTINTYTGTTNSQDYNSQTLRTYFSDIRINGNSVGSGNNKVVQRSGIYRGTQVTINVTPMWQSGINSGYTYYDSNTKRYNTIYTSSVIFRGKNGEKLSGTQNGNSFTFRMPESDMDIWIDLSYSSRIEKYQEWEYVNIPGYAASFDPMGVVGYPGEGPTLCWSMGKAGYSCSRLQELDGRGWVTLTDQKHCGGDGDCSKITVSIRVTNGGARYEWEIRCGRPKSCAFAENGHGTEFKADEWEDSRNARDNSIRIARWKDV